MSPWLFNLTIGAVMKEVKMGMGRMVVTFSAEVRERKLPNLFYANDQVFGKEEDLRVKVKYLFRYVIEGV